MEYTPCRSGGWYCGASSQDYIHPIDDYARIREYILRPLLTSHVRYLDWFWLLLGWRRREARSYIRWMDYWVINL